MLGSLSKSVFAIVRPAVWFISQRAINSSKKVDFGIDDYCKNAGCFKFLKTEIIKFITSMNIGDVATLNKFEPN